MALCLPLPSQATTITIVNLDAAGVGLNETTPAAPVGGNTGTTKGAQALIVFQQAAQLWAAQLSSSVEIRVDAHFQPLSCTVNQGTLGSAGPISISRDFAGAPRASTWYAIALANSRFGSDIDPASSDISMQFNGAMGTTGCLEGLSWYMGLDTAAPANSISLLSVALHEMGHGLGFLSFVNLASGAKLGGFDDTFMVFLERHSTALNYPAMTDAQRVAASISNGDLHWTGAFVLGANGSLTAGVSGGHVQMFAPNPAQPGSSVSHFDTALTPSELMEPSYVSANLTLTRTVLLMRDIGWITSSCGNGSVQPGEQCDDGNASNADCCTTACTFSPTTTACRSLAGVCDSLEFCTGVSAGCPGDSFLSTAAACRPSAGLCDVAENCSGSAAACPANGKSMSPCRSASGVCDVAESCNGTSDACPADSFLPNTSPCRPSTGVCDPTENCTGTSAACPGSTFSGTTTICRASAGICDTLERCTGSTAPCPADSFVSSSTPCRQSAGVCDVAETCSGAGAACPADSFSSAVCRSATAVCDATESCTGSAAACPANGFAGTGFVCRGSGGSCDPAENCTGASNACPGDTLSSSATVCRPAAAECDTAEACNGSAASCPANSQAGPGTPCTSDSQPCTTDTCNGFGTCTHDPNSVPCNDGAFCNGADTCAGGTCSSHAGNPCVGIGNCDEAGDVCGSCVPGDCNQSAGIEAGDPICTVLCLIESAPEFADCGCAADCNCLGGTEAGDPICTVLRLIDAFTPDTCAGGASTAIERVDTAIVVEPVQDGDAAANRSVVRLNGDDARRVGGMKVVLDLPPDTGGVRLSRRLQRRGFTLQASAGEGGVAALVLPPASDPTAPLRRGPLLRVRSAPQNVRVSASEYASIGGLPLKQLEDGAR